MLKRVGPLLLAFVVAVALAAWFYNGRDDDGAPTAKPAQTGLDFATLTPAARKVANRFIATAVARRDPAAWRLLDPDFPCMEGKAKHAWQSGQLRFVPVGPFRTNDVSFSVSGRRPKSISLDVFIQRIDRRRARFMMVLKRHGRDNWLVRWWDIPWGPPSAWCR